MNVRSLWQKLKSVRHLEWILLAIVLGITGSVLLQSETGTYSQSGQTDMEKRLARVLSEVAGAGKVEVIVHTSQESTAQSVGSFGTPAQKAEEKPRGVIVVAEGAVNLQVRLDLARAVQTLLDLPASAVEVLPKEKPP